MSALKQFEKQQYLNIETFRKNGNGVKTPVWFVQDGERLFIWAESASGKAKRVRNNCKVKIAPSRGDGVALGDWIPSSARCDDSPDALKSIRELMIKKYGLMFHLFGLLGKLRNAHYTTLKIELY
jgi:uncharacterized protein